MTGDLYPEITTVGSLAKALDIEFAKINSSLRSSSSINIRQLPTTYARVENKKRFSQVYIAAKEKLYLPDFWRDGVCLAHGSTNNIYELIQALTYWLSKDVDTTSLVEKFQFVTANKEAKAFDENNEVSYKWDLILNDSSKKDIKPFVELAVKDNIVSRLFPFTSLMRLCFSRCTGYPYTSDTPIVTPINKNRFEVRTAKNVLIGIGNAKEALKMVKDNLPLDIKPAIKGTAEDLQNCT